MSDDERDNSSWMKRYRILKIKGRSRDLERIFRIVDAIERLDSKKSPVTRCQLRLRFISNRPSKRTFHIRSLPVNIYDSAWLADMNELEREGLEIIDREFDLSVGEGLIK